MMYCAGFDLAQVASLGTITLATAGKSDAVVTLGSMTGTRMDAGGSSTLMWHGPLGNVFTSEDGASQSMLGEWCDTRFPYILQTALRAAATTSSWTSPSGITVTFSTTTGLMTIAYPTATFSITWSTAAGRAICGFSATQSGGTSYVGTVVPTYVIVPTLPSTSNPTLNYEPAGIANHVRTDTNGGYGVSREISPVCRDWVQQFETNEKTVAISAESTHPFTFEHLIKHCRGQYPFCVVDGFGYDTDECFSFRSEGTVWRPQPASEGNHAQIHISFSTWVEAEITAAA